TSSIPPCLRGEGKVTVGSQLGQYFFTVTICVTDQKDNLSCTSRRLKSGEEGG
ncbi:hypothetical protein NDU88_001247, partial [Pleurodeles waltl]